MLAWVDSAVAARPAEAGRTRSPLLPRCRLHQCHPLCTRPGLRRHLDDVADVLVANPHQPPFGRDHRRADWSCFTTFFSSIHHSTSGFSSGGSVS